MITSNNPEVIIDPSYGNSIDALQTVTFTVKIPNTFAVGSKFDLYTSITGDDAPAYLPFTDDENTTSFTVVAEQTDTPTIALVNDKNNVNNTANRHVIDAVLSSDVLTGDISPSVTLYYIAATAQTNLSERDLNYVKGQSSYGYYGKMAAYDFAISSRIYPYYPPDEVIGSLVVETPRISMPSAIQLEFLKANTEYSVLVWAENQGVKSSVNKLPLKFRTKDNGGQLVKLNLLWKNPADTLEDSVRRN